MRGSSASWDAHTEARLQAASAEDGACQFANGHKAAREHPGEFCVAERRQAFRCRAISSDDAKQNLDMLVLPNQGPECRSGSPWVDSIRLCSKVYEADWPQPPFHE